MENTSSENIAKALDLLEDAARQKKDELRAVLSDKHTHLKNLIMEKESSLMDTLTATKDRALQTATHVKDVSVEKARELARGVDESVHHNPWLYIAGATVGGVLLGFILGRRRQ